MAKCRNTCQYTCQSVSATDLKGASTRWKGPLVWDETPVQGHIGTISGLTTIGNSKNRIAFGSHQSVYWQVRGNWESSRHIWIVYFISQSKVWLDALNVCHRFFLPVGLLLKLIEHVQRHVHLPSIVCASDQYFVVPRTTKKSRDRKGLPWHELGTTRPYWSCFRTLIVLQCSHLSFCWSILSWPESWPSASFYSELRIKSAARP